MRLNPQRQASALRTRLPGRSSEGERRLDFRQLQPRRLLFLDLLHVQIVETAGQLFPIRKQRTQFLEVCTR